MSNKFIIEERLLITTFLNELHILIFLTLSQIKHIVEIIASTSQEHFDGKIVDIEKPSQNHI